MWIVSVCVCDRARNNVDVFKANSKNSFFFFFYHTNATDGRLDNEMVYTMVCISCLQQRKGARRGRVGEEGRGRQWRNETHIAHWIELIGHYEIRSVCTCFCLSVRSVQAYAPFINVYYATNVRRITIYIYNNIYIAKLRTMGRMTQNDGNLSFCAHGHIHCAAFHLWMMLVRRWRQRPQRFQFI